MEISDDIFFNDAVRASEVLNIRLTSRSKESPNPIPMAGVPIHALDNYLPRLLSAGCSCVVISQTEDGKDRRASGGKGMMQREISRIVTPGVRFEGDGLDESSFNLLAALARDDGSSAVALVDVSTGWLRVYECEGHDELVEVVRRVRPSEIYFRAPYKQSRSIAAQAGLKSSRV